MKIFKILKEIMLIINNVNSISMSFFNYFLKCKILNKK